MEEELLGRILAADEKQELEFPETSAGAATSRIGRRSKYFAVLAASFFALSALAENQLSPSRASIPIVDVRGAKPGPVLALVSGAHGTEYASIIALEKVIQSLDPAQVSGTVIILPLVNIPSFEQKVPHVNPVDGKSCLLYTSPSPRD